MGAWLALGTPALVFWGSNQSISARSAFKLLLWFEVPVLVMTAFLYDYHPKRRAWYFWGGSAVIATSLIVLLDL
jgi:hypothetical protein